MHERLERVAVGQSPHFFRHKLQRGPLVKDRDRHLLEITRGKRILHVGCVDWPFSEERLQRGELLHAKLLRQGSAVLGLDIDAAGMEVLRDAIGGTYLELDLTDSSVNLTQLKAFQPDVIVAGDVIEHVSSAQDLMRGLARAAEINNAQVVVTTPNSLAFRSMLNTAVGVELMHPDHVAVYSPITLRVVIERSGLHIDSWSYYSIRTGPDPLHVTYDGISRLAARLRPAWGDGHLVVCRVAEQ